MSKTNQISNIEIKNLIEHSLKIIMANFDERISQLEEKMIAIEAAITNSGTRIPKTPNKPFNKSKEIKKGDTNLSDALKLIGHE